MILLMAAAYLGAALSLLVLWPFGALTAILAMPIGGSLGAVLERFRVTRTHNLSLQCSAGIRLV